MKTVLLTGLTLLLCGATPVCAEVPVATFRIGVGESAKVEGADLTIGFDSVVHDSRCPTSVTCVWEGDAEVSLWAESPGFAIQEFTLNTHPDGVQEVRVFDYVVQIVSLDPYPAYPVLIEPEKYALAFHVVKAARTSAEAVSMGMAKGRYRY